MAKIVSGGRTDFQKYLDSLNNEVIKYETFESAKVVYDYDGAEIWYWFE